MATYKSPLNMRKHRCALSVMESTVNGEWNDASSPSVDVSGIACVSLNDWIYVVANEDNPAANMQSDKVLERQSWTDDLPVDKDLSGVGFGINQIYKDDGYRHEEHAFEDKCFRFRLSDKCFLYGVFDGHSGDRASEFVSQRFPAEVLLGQLDTVTSDSQVQTIIQQAYQTVEKAYFDTLDDLIVERTSLQLDLQQRLQPEIVDRLRAIDTELSSGTSALVALLLDNKLYIANVGNSRALLCRTENGNLIVEKLHNDHTLENEQEVQRLASLGLPIADLRKSTKLGHQVYTRCLGDYSVKGGYKDHEQMRSAINEPVIADPDIEPPIELDQTCNFLLLMSDGVYKTLEDATKTDRVNSDIAAMVATEYLRQSTLNGVAQAVVDSITRLHHDAYTLAHPGDPAKVKCARRDDLTLLVRNINYAPRLHVPENPAIPHGLTFLVGSPMASDSSDHSTPTPGSTPTTGRFATQTTNPFFPAYNLGIAGPNTVSEPIDQNDSFSDVNRISSIPTPLERDADGRINAYVSFAEFNTKVAAMSEEDREALERELIPKMDCETILEQPETGPEVYV